MRTRSRPSTQAWTCGRTSESPDRVAIGAGGAEECGVDRLPASAPDAPPQVLGRRPRRQPDLVRHQRARRYHAPDPAREPRAHAPPPPLRHLLADEPPASPRAVRVLL